MALKWNFEIHKNILNFAHPMAQEISALLPLLETQKNIVITTHAKPDGDAMGSSLALFNMLQQLEHKITVITPTDYPGFLSWLPGNDLVLKYPENKDKSSQLIADADLIFCLDFNELKRIQDMKDLVHESNAKKIMIDHHLHPSEFDDYRLSKSNASSTAELIFEFYELLKDQISLNKEIASCIYTGIMTDTGSFSFDSTTARVHRVIAELIDQDINIAKIHNLIYDSFSENRLRFLGHILLNKMKIMPEYNAAYIALEKEDLELFELRTGDTEGIVNYPLGINGILLAVLITDRTTKESKDKDIRISLRSIGDISVNELSARYFNGGGHKNAAGGQVNTSVSDAIDRFKMAIKDLKDQLS